MTTLLCISDVHNDEKKLKQIAGFAKGCDALITAGDDLDQQVQDKEGNIAGFESDIILEELKRKHQPESKASEEELQQFNALYQEFSESPTEGKKAQVQNFLQNHPEVNKVLNAEEEAKQEFINHYNTRAEGINKYYKQAGILGFGTSGNHDPLSARKSLSAVNYLLGKTAEFKGLVIAGLPATGEAFEAANKFPDLYQHLQFYDTEETSKLAKMLLEHTGKIDVFVTHKAYKPEIQQWDPHYKEGQPLAKFGVDKGAVEVDEKFKPALNVFGHYHLERAKVKRSEDGKQWFLYVGPNAAVRVEFDKEKRPFLAKSVYYN